MARPSRMMDLQDRPTIEAVGLRGARWRDLYHRVLDARWSTFFIALFVGYLAIHALFAQLYLAEPGSITSSDGGFWDAYFFSVQTMMTIGYGSMAPATRYAHAIVTLEAFLGLLLTAVTTGLVFAKFSRPSSNVLFSRVVVVSDHDGVPTLMFRMANARGNRIVDAGLTLVLARTIQTREGKPFRRLEDLKLSRTRTPLFSVGWTALHAIDATSPLYGIGAAELRATSAELIVILAGTDDTSMQTVHARHTYDDRDIRFGERLVDIITLGRSGNRVVDYTRFHDTEPAPLTRV